MQPRVLIVGGDSTIGRALVAKMSADGWQVVHSSRRTPLPAGAFYLDLSLPVNPSTLANDDFTVAIFCAGIPGLQACVEKPAYARQINVDGTLALARLLSSRGTFVIYLSTNLVFDGQTAFPRESTPVSPQNEYGRQKAEVEREILALTSPAAVVRLTKVFHPGLPLLKKWLAALCGGEGIKAFVDLPVSPVLLDDVVRGLCVVSSKRAGGVWHFSGPADYSYFEVARSLAVLVGAPLALVEPVNSSIQQPHSCSATFSALGMERTNQQIPIDFPILDHVLNRLDTSPVRELAGGNTP